jgi:hypothetical protein
MDEENNPVKFEKTLTLANSKINPRKKKDLTIWDFEPEVEYDMTRMKHKSKSSKKKGVLERAKEIHKDETKNIRSSSADNIKSSVKLNS